MEAIISGINWLDDFIWGMPMIVLLLGTHLFMTVRTGFIQRKTFTGILLSVRKDPDAPGDVSQFQALTTALASTIGTGNIIGVGTAIFLGGPGAVFWCWLAGVFGIATKYAESLIAVKYRVRTPDGRMQGGAMYALERGLNLKWLGVLFAAVILLGSLLLAEPPEGFHAAMAPAAYDTLRAHFTATATGPEDYDLIVTGDLGLLGHQIVTDLFRQDGVDMTKNYTDCGLLLYHLEKQDMHAGGSGCGCSAAVFNGYLLRGLREGRWKHLLFAPTGALLSPTSSFQGESIPGICHAVALSAAKEGV